MNVFWIYLILTIIYIANWQSAYLSHLIIICHIKIILQPSLIDC